MLLRRAAWSILLGYMFFLLSACQVPRASQYNNAAMYHTQLGLAYLQQGQIARAKHNLLIAIALQPNSEYPYLGMAYFLEQSGDIDQAHTYYLKALHMSHESSAQLNNYAVFLCKHKQYNLAKHYFLRAAHDIHYLNNAQAYANAGFCAVTQKKSSQAIVFLHQAMQHDPNRKEVLVQLLQLEIKLKRYEDALKVVNDYNDQVQKYPELLALAMQARQGANQY